MKAEYDFSKARRGAVVPTAAGKTRITIRLDADVIDWFKAQVNEAGGGNYQSLYQRGIVSGSHPAARTRADVASAHSRAAACG